MTFIKLFDIPNFRGFIYPVLISARPEQRPHPLDPPLIWVVSNGEVSHGLKSDLTKEPRASLSEFKIYEITESKILHASEDFRIFF